ncbi:MULTISPECIES: DUF3011 domain-containing protein [unclassified Ensifer]|uniref:DUF3011 domain-containing protein n=1 Tax=unclassified Ensifer TaxID=2633371 RepID=UPI000813AAF1|nr:MULTISPECIES: DUF3011 domain-containing protein [unclassified Ensifer]OCP01808.1 hypothetical protein BC362_21615 [Ensifer sp. LC14]OCP09597.1 hypothetical protein BC374_03355 [Ensifer sp. LC13]OCP10853.1 hypothetical protein BBX50_03700 [Ensifer sp. LC11]OCP32844.1 hypothetical protein BC364_03355 [Ensifer sp. LC499]
MFRTIASAVLVLAALGPSVPANAQGPQGATVECRSRNFQYDECFAGPLSQPQLIYQISGSPCILNKSWGFNPKSRYLWVAQGCSGVFADVGGYHYGRGDGYDPNARMYNQHGHDTGAVVAGAVLGAILSGIADGKHAHSASNYHDNGGYNGCHGTGCLVDNPDTASQQIDTTPQFDKEGNPNFDTEGNYQGCHGVGCLVDNPDSSN